MNLEESNRIYQENKQKNTRKKGIIAGIVLCIITVIVCAIIIFILQQMENNRFKMLVDGKEVAMAENFVVKDEAGNDYVDLKMIAQYTGYRYTQGDYIEINEDKNSCFIENDYEVVSFKANENGFVKYIKNTSSLIQENENENENEEQKVEETIKFEVKSKNKEKEIFKTELPVIIINENIYIPLDIVNIVCNANINLTKKSLTISSINKLVETCSGLAPRLGYNMLSSTYENIRAISNNMLVVGDGSKFGVISLIDGKNILGVKYDDIIYIQNQNKFYIYVDNKVGLVNGDGTTIIAPKNYDSIETFDADKNLYLVKENGKYGLLDYEGNSILHTDYDKIGISNIEDFGLEIDNESLWFDKIVAIKQGTIWGLYNIEKKEVVLDLNFDGFGYTKQSTDTLGEESLLIIPRETGVEGIVVMLDGYYGIYDIKIQELIIPCACSRIYSITNNGKTKYYMEFAGQQIDMKEYFEDKGLVTVEKNKDTVE